MSRPFRRTFHPAVRKALFSAAAGLAAMGAVGSLSTPANAQSSSPTTTAASKVIKLGIRESSLGPIMVDANGMSLYMFAPDRYNVSVCEGQCLTAWPPIMLQPGQSLSSIELSGGLRYSKLGVAFRENGSRQVTYNGWPLYYWFRDAKAGDVLGQWVGNVWWVLNDDGVPNTARVKTTP
jgi:predicted lipoprotein with Yx(FWY)xxD motif